MSMPAPPRFSTRRYFAAPIQCAPRYPIRTTNHKRTGSSPRAFHTFRPGKSRIRRKRTSELPPYCRITCSVLRSQVRLGGRVSGWGVTGGVGTLCGSPLRATRQEAGQFPIRSIVEDRDGSGILIPSVKSFSNLFFVLFVEV